MALVNHAKKEINAKIVYFGPPGSGKSSALNYIYSRIKATLRGDLKCVPASDDKLLFFDFSPFETPMPNGYRFRLHVYTLTGMVTNPATWRMTLKGADGIMIVVDPTIERVSEIRESISQLRDFLAAYGVGLHDTPALLQLNDTSVDNIPLKLSGLIEELKLTMPSCRSNPATGEGLLEALTMLSRQVLERVSVFDQQHDGTELKDNVSDEPEYTSTATDPESNSEKASDIYFGRKPRVTLLPNEISLNGSVLRIPLDIQCGDAQNRLVVTVAIESE